jgi:hypothetical protein
MHQSSLLQPQLLVGGGGRLGQGYRTCKSLWKTLLLERLTGGQRADVRKPMISCLWVKASDKHACCCCSSQSTGDSASSGRGRGGGDDSDLLGDDDDLSDAAGQADAAELLKVGSGWAGRGQSGGGVEVMFSQEVGPTALALARAAALLRKDGRRGDGGSLK